jgi:hypothetical protein
MVMLRTTNRTNLTNKPSGVLSNETEIRSICQIRGLSISSKSCSLTYDIL